jgi:hypothetical protein
MHAEVNRDKHSEFQRAAEVKNRHEDELLSKANVVGVGIGIRQQEGVYTGEVALIVMVREKLPEAQISDEDLVPAEIEGVPVDVQEVGSIDAQ